MNASFSAKSTFSLVGQEPPGVIKDLHSIYANLEQNPSPKHLQLERPQDVVYDTPNVRMNMYVRFNV